MTYTGHRPREELTAGGLPDHYEMYASPRWWTWFSVRKWPWQSPVQGDYDKLAERVAGFVPELEMALLESRLGPHMRHVVIPTSRVPGSERN